MEPGSSRDAEDARYTTLLSVCEARNTNLRALQRELRGDLDTIVLKALAKEPTRRYQSVEKLADDLYAMDSRLSISEANEVLQIDLPTTEFHTVGGLVLARLRHIPKVGEYIVEAGYRFTVVEASERAINKLKVEPESAAAQSPSPE